MCPHCVLVAIAWIVGFLVSVPVVSVLAYRWRRWYESRHQDCGHRHH